MPPASENASQCMRSTGVGWTRNFLSADPLRYRTIAFASAMSDTVASLSRAASILAAPHNSGLASRPSQANLYMSERKDSNSGTVNRRSFASFLSTGTCCTFSVMYLHMSMEMVPSDPCTSLRPQNSEAPCSSFPTLNLALSLSRTGLVLSG
eukprot:1298415-Amphidinium_carterae.1